MAEITFNNSIEIEKYFNQVIKKVVEAVSRKLLDDFLIHLDETIYSAPTGTEYKRFKDKGGFYSGWGIRDEQQKEIGDYVKSLIFNGNKLVAPTPDNKLAHGGLSGGDQRGKMAWILNDLAANYDYAYNEGARYLTKDSGNSIGYWDSYLQKWEKKCEKWFNDEFKKYGIQRG